jgi:hypothetical protein
MAIGGLEGYQTMWIKHKDSLCESFHHPEALPIIEKIMGGIRHGK